MSTIKPRATREVRNYRWDIVGDGPDTEVPVRFVLRMDIAHQVEDKRAATGWLTDHTDYAVTLTETPLTRFQLAAVIGDGASTLAYAGEPA